MTLFVGVLVAAIVTKTVFVVYYAFSKPSKPDAGPVSGWGTREG